MNRFVAPDGFIGSPVVDRHVTDDHEVTLLDNPATGVRKNLGPQAGFTEVDIRESPDKQVKVPR